MDLFMATGWTCIELTLCYSIFEAFYIYIYIYIVTGRCHSTDSWLPTLYPRQRIDGYPITRNGWAKHCIRGNRYAL
jgi:hypothetical protein